MRIQYWMYRAWTLEAIQWCTVMWISRCASNVGNATKFWDYFFSQETAVYMENLHMGSSSKVKDRFAWIWCVLQSRLGQGWAFVSLFKRPHHHGYNLVEKKYTSSLLCLAPWGDATLWGCSQVCGARCEVFFPFFSPGFLVVCPYSPFSRYVIFIWLQWGSIFPPLK